MPATDHTTPAQRGGGDGVRMDCPACAWDGYRDCGACKGTGEVEAARWCGGCSEPGATVWLPHPTVSDAVLCELEQSGRIVRAWLTEGRCEACL